MAKSRILHENHTAAYPAPIAVAEGDPLSPTGRQDIWDGHRWLWAVAADGREGWIPDALIVERDGRSVAARAYSARELTCRAGESVSVLEETHGWAWCRNDEGAEGWLPLGKLSTA